MAIFLEPISCKLILCNKVGGGVDSAAGEVVEVIYKKTPFHVCLHTLIFSTFVLFDTHFPKHVYQLKARFVFKNISLI